MATTTRLGLRKPATTDNVNVGTDLDNNFDAIDNVIGFTTCTSTTRPSTPFQGQPIRETDTGSYYVSNGSSPASGSWVPMFSTEGPVTVGATGTAAPWRIQTTSTIAGNRLLDTRKQGDAQSGYILDFDGHMQWGPGGATNPDTELYRAATGALGIKGGALLGGFVVSALSQVTNPYAGQRAFNTTDGILYRYDGAAWKAAAALGGNAVGTRHSARYRQTTAQSIPNAVDTPIQFQTVDRPCNDVVASGTGNSTFTPQRSGIWTIAAGCRFVPNSGAGERGLSICTDPVTTSANHLLQTSVFPGGGPGTLALSLTDYFTSGTPIDIGSWQNCGAALNMDLALPNAVRVTFTYHGQEE